MGSVAVTLKVMPTSPSVDMVKLKSAVEKKLVSLGARIGSTKEEPIAFGLKVLIVIFLWPENQDPDPIETDLAKIENVNSAQISDVRRTLG